MLREKILANAAGIFADIESEGAALNESLLRDISVPGTIVDARLSPPFLRRSSHRLKRLFPQARSVTLENRGHRIALDAHDELLKILHEAA